MASRALTPAGRATSQSPLTRATSAKAPRCVSPRPQPLRITRSPGFQFGFDDAVTVPAKSMPLALNVDMLASDQKISRGGAQDDPRQMAAQVGRSGGGRCGQAGDRLL